MRLNEQQRVRIIAGTGGTFTLTFSGQTTAPIPYDASRTELTDALEALDVNNGGDILVSGESINVMGLTVEFRGQWTYVETIPNLSYDGAALSGTGSVEVIQIRSGSGGTGVQERVSAVYKQAGDSWCQSCYGIGFEGGFEAVIYVSWALIGDQQQETTRTVGGAMQKADPHVQFSFEPMVQEFDLMARVEAWEDDNITPRLVRGRYIIREITPVTVRTGPGTPDDSINTMPEAYRTRYQIPSNQWVVGQKGGLEILPFEHVWNLVPLTRHEERLVEMGITENRHWYQQVETEALMDPRLTKP